MIITIAEARKLIGEKQNEYTDTQVEEIVNVFTFFTDLAIDCYVESKKAREGGGETCQQHNLRKGNLSQQAKEDTP